MKKKRSLTAIMAIAIVLIVTFFLCLKFCNLSTTVETKKAKIAFLVPTLSNPFWVDMTNGAQEQANKMGNIELIIKSSTNIEDPLSQNQIVEDLITQNVDGICIVPLYSESIITAILQANKANIPVINVDNKINMEMAESKGAKILTFIGSDNYEGGKLAGQYIVEMLNGKGKVAILEGFAGNDASINRKGGFLDVIKSKPEIEIVSSQIANFDREQAFKIFQNVLKSNPDLNALFAVNDEMALGAYAALEQSGIPKSKIIIVGFDAIEEALEALKLGKLNATVAQKPKLMGEQGVLLMKDVLDNKVLEMNYSTGVELVTK